MTQIPPYSLWLGHSGDGRDYATLFEAGIQALVHAAIEDPPDCPPRDFIYVRIPLLDGTGNDSRRLRVAVRIVVELLDRGEPTLLYCGAGMSRSPALAAAAMSQIGRGSVEDCLQYIAGYRRVDVSPGFWNELKSSLH
jgi:protein-tyrosine phosphatase